MTTCSHTPTCGPGLCNDRDPDKYKELREAEATFVAASEQAEQLRIIRNQLVAQALQAGWTHTQISLATGLSRGRIGQIAQTR